MVNDDDYITDLDVLIGEVKAVQRANEDIENIASLHNNLGNVKQYLSGVSTAMNGSNQNLLLVAAQKSMQNFIYDLYNVRHMDYISISTFETINKQTNELINKLSSLIDSDYN